MTPACINCKHYAANEPVKVPPPYVAPHADRTGWKLRLFGDGYDSWDAAYDTIKRDNAMDHNESGWCQLNPKHIKTWHTHTCSHHAANI